jgi:hypothetical protein
MLSDAALDEFFRIAALALRHEDEVIREGMRRARETHNFYSEQRGLGLASVREEAAGWTIFRELLRSGYPSAHGVEVQWEGHYPDPANRQRPAHHQRADLAFQMRDQNGCPQPVACMELKYGVEKIRQAVERDVKKMRRLCAEVSAPVVDVLKARKTEVPQSPAMMSPDRFPDRRGGTACWDRRTSS